MATGINVPRGKHGGKRPGAGRKLLGKVKMARVNVTLGDNHIDKAAEIGDGNISLGIRRVLEKNLGGN